MSWAIWLTGLPGSGKSTIAERVAAALGVKGVVVEVLSMDRVRKKLSGTEKPEYKGSERDNSYHRLAELGSMMVKQGKNIIFDATAHKKEYRDYARSLIEKFKEVHIKCELDVAMQRESQRTDNPEMRNLYKRAIAGARDIGELPGVNVPYEEPLYPELVIESNELTTDEAADKIIEMIKWFDSEN